MNKTDKELMDTIEDLVRQFAYAYEQEGAAPGYATGGLSALEEAFDVLGWSDPHPAPEMACGYPECHRFATCGTPTKQGYKRCCAEHFEVYQPEGRRQP